MTRPEAEAAARSLVAERFPEARQAWLSGSVVLGNATETSDLDITVLLDSTETYRESLTHEGGRSSSSSTPSRPSGTSSPRTGPAAGRRWPDSSRPAYPSSRVTRERRSGQSARPRWPQAPSRSPRTRSTFARYSLTDQLDDLAGGGSPAVVDAVAVDVWRGTAELLLAAAGWWSGTGKWLVREVEAMDAARGTTYAQRLHDGLHRALVGDPDALDRLADEVLDQVGGRLWSGFRQVAVIPT